MTILKFTPALNNPDSFIGRSITVEIPVNSYNKNSYKLIGQFVVEFDDQQVPILKIDSQEEFDKDWYVYYIPDEVGETIIGIQFQIDNASLLLLQVKDIFIYQYQKLVDQLDEYAQKQIVQYKPDYKQFEKLSGPDRASLNSYKIGEFNKQFNLYTDDVVKKGYQLINEGQTTDSDHNKVLRAEIVEAGQDFIGKFRKYRP